MWSASSLALLRALLRALLPPASAVPARRRLPVLGLVPGPTRAALRRRLELLLAAVRRPMALAALGAIPT